MDDDDEVVRGYEDREPNFRIGAEDGKKGGEEEGKEEEGKEEEEEVKPKKKKVGPPPGKPKRKTGQFKFGTGMNGSEEFEKRKSSGGEGWSEGRLERRTAGAKRLQHNPLL